MPVSTYKLKIGGQLCKCPTCHEVFSGEKSFDLHRVRGEGQSRSCFRLVGSNRHSITMPKGGTKVLVLKDFNGKTYWGIER